MTAKTYTQEQVDEIVKRRMDAIQKEVDKQLNTNVRNVIRDTIRALDLEDSVQKLLDEVNAITDLSKRKNKFRSIIVQHPNMMFVQVGYKLLTRSQFYACPDYEWLRVVGNNLFVKNSSFQTSNFLGCVKLKYERILSKHF